METNEHRNAGNKIRIMTLGNPYLEGSKGLSERDNNNLCVRMMRLFNGIPVPLEFPLEAGDIVALAGDFYTKAGWGLDLQLPPLTGHVKKDNEWHLHDFDLNLLRKYIKNNFQFKSILRLPFLFMPIRYIVVLKK